MALYVDGFVIPIPKRNIEAYRKIAKKAARVWKEHGALEYRECVGDDLKVKVCLDFPRGIRSKPNETIVFSWITYKSRQHRDRVNARVMKDPRVTEMMNGQEMPFDTRRMMYGGFKAIVEA